MRKVCKPFDIENRNRRIGDRFTEYELRIGAERLFKLFVRRILIDKGTLDSKLLKRHGKQVYRTAINL